MSGPDLDFSLKSAPDSWIEPEDTGQVTPYKNPNKDQRRQKVNLSQKPADVFTGSILLVLVSALVGAFWFTGQVNTQTPLAVYAVPIGVLYAVVLRLGAGRGDPDIRAMIASIFYGVTVLGTAYLVTRHNYISIYGHEPGPADLDRWLLRSRLGDPAIMLSWVGGFWAAIHVSYLFGRRKSKKR